MIASYSGFVNGDTSASLTTAPTLSTSASEARRVGSYAITATGAVDADYTISYIAGTLTVTPAALTITADNQSKGYGAALPALTAKYSGFVNGDTSASLTTPPTLSTSATAASHVGSYAITASGAVDADYAISYVAGSLTVTPAALTITADNQATVYGATLPTLTASYSGFVNGERQREPDHCAIAEHQCDCREPTGQIRDHCCGRRRRGLPILVRQWDAILHACPDGPSPDGPRPNALGAGYGQRRGHHDLHWSRRNCDRASAAA